MIIFGIIFPKMKPRTQHAVLAAIAKTLRPIVRLCLDNGLGHAALTELLRQIFVEEAGSALTKDNQKATGSAISGLTGLSRKEVARLKSVSGDDLVQVSERRDRATRVLSGWVNDSEFSYAAGTRSLPLQGESGSFNALVKRYGGDVTTVAMLQLLSNSGNVELTGDKVVFLSEAYIPRQAPLETLNILGTDSAELLNTVLHNINADPSQKRFQRKVATPLLRKQDLEAFRHLVNKQSMVLLEQYDAWLAAHQVTDSNNAEATYVAVGIYYYENV